MTTKLTKRQSRLLQDLNNRGELRLPEYMPGVRFDAQILQKHGLAQIDRTIQSGWIVTKVS